jgi:hypothetical protein
MDFSEFLRRLGADPNDRDPDLLRARRSGGEFERAAIEAERFERQLARATRLPAPDGLLDRLRAVGDQADSKPAAGKRFRHLALAAGLLIAVGAAGVTWNLNRGWDSVDDYVMDHYRHDGPATLRREGTARAGEVQELFARFDVQAAAGLADMVRVIKVCPTPNGKGVHLVLDTAQGPITVIYMPGTRVEDHQGVGFEGMDALYVSLKNGSAVIIGQPEQSIDSLYTLVQQSLIPFGKEA